ncbi:hypothetical protein CMESO_474 (nucleomorph) [Chroomonas mesostigmatica CCMP1168]|uniref:DUF218 domain-containing protein n=1 Tax=Chroomonas mesostigmatica CCMP1168 TaxID=1195612 RepID=J7G3J2_9CRYP|nr:hypothetical protein CMESO_474 [Chroomonas mesostigmatica CCMP1168]|mmetsp:Transcript_58815/g.144186  ORF Transcript_58815/g.144186 Transcript_58815/m.144186 type:complete len:426 (-) Transcript_58815:1193-2470(-)
MFATLSSLDKISFSYFISPRLIEKNNVERKIFQKKKKKYFNIKLMQNKNKKNNSKLRLHEIADKLTDLLSFGKFPESILQEEFKGHLESTMHVAVIFSKILTQNQITVEFERRVITVLTQLKNQKFKPDIIAFIGGHKKSNKISGAKAGYIYFRYIASEAKVDLGGLDFIIEETTQSTQKNLINLLKSLQKKYGDEAVSKCHFTLISSDYHLIRIAEIYKLSRRQSLLTPLDEVGATWTYLFAAYPFCVSPDPTLAFLGRIRVLANDLAIVLVNLNGLVEFNDLVAKENFSRLCETNQKLRAMLRIMSEPGSFLNSSGSSIEIPFEQWEILERSLCTIHEVQVNLTPLVNGKSVDRRILIRSRDLLMGAVKDIRLTIDPDRPLKQEEWVFSLGQMRNRNSLQLKIKNVENKNSSTKKNNFPFSKK